MGSKTYSPGMREKIIIALADLNNAKLDDFKDVCSNRDIICKIMNNLCRTKTSMFGKKWSAPLVSITRDPNNRRKTVYNVTMDGKQYADYVREIRRVENAQSESIIRNVRGNTPIDDQESDRP